jgi:RNAse (barnase) inhibitor barstar
MFNIKNELTSIFNMKLTATMFLVFLFLLTLIIILNNKNIEKFVADNEKLLDCTLSSGIYNISDEKFKCCDPKYAKTPLCINETVIDNSADPLTGKTNEEKKMYLDILIASLETQLRALIGIEEEKKALYITEETNRVDKEGDVAKQVKVIDTKTTEKERLIVKKSRLEDTKQAFDKYKKTVELDNKVNDIDALEDMIRNKIQSAIQHVVTQIGDLTKSYVYIIHLLFTIRESKRYNISLDSEKYVLDKALDIKKFERDIYKLFVTIKEIQHLYQLRINDQTDPNNVIESFIVDEFNKSIPVSGDMMAITGSPDEPDKTDEPVKPDEPDKTDEPVKTEPDLKNVIANTVNLKYENPDINITLANGISSRLDWKLGTSKYVYVKNYKETEDNKMKIDRLSSYIFTGFSHSDCDFETKDQNNICSFVFTETYTDPTSNSNTPVYLDSDPSKITPYAFLFQGDIIPDNQMVMNFPCMSSLEFVIRQVYECNKTNDTCSDLYSAIKNPSQTNTSYLNNLASIIQETILTKIFPS